MMLTVPPLPKEALLGQTNSSAESRKQELRVAAYGIKAIKRCYHLIPLTPIREYQSKYLPALKYAQLLVKPGVYVEKILVNAAK
jgi:hypothetical protein